MDSLDDFQKRKEDLIRIINENKALEKSYLKSINTITSQLEVNKKELEKIKRKKEEINEEEEENQKKINKLKKKIEEYKETKKNEKKEEIKKKIYDSLEEIKKLNFKINFGIFEDFRKLEEISEKSSLKSFFLPIYKQKKEELVEKISKNINLLLEAPKKTHEAFFYLKFLIKCENIFKEPFFTEFFFRKISDKFTFHFLSEKETNRLDKPEWMFKFLAEEIEKIHCFFLIFKKDFTIFLQKIDDLVKIKIREIYFTKSEQRRKLLWHFLDEYLIFLKNSDFSEENSKKKDSFSKPNLQEISKMILEIEQDFINKSINEIHKLSYKKWFKEYKELTDEAFQFCKRFSKIEPKSIDILVFVLRKILEFYEIFVEEMRFSSKNEIKLLCEIYSQIEKYKKYLESEENELLIFNCDFDFSLFQRTASNFFIFNQQNYKILKEILLDESEKLSRKIKKFNFVEEDLIVNFVIELSSLLSLYKDCSSFCALEEEVKRFTDLFVYEEVILKIKLSSEQCFKLKDLVKRLNDLFVNGVPLSSKGHECLQFVFDEKIYLKDVDLFEKIKEIYE